MGAALAPVAPVLTAARPWRRVGLRFSLVMFYAGLIAVYVPNPLVGHSAAFAMVQGGLALGVLIAPLEYALGALCFAFVAASSAELWTSFQLMRWVFLIGGGALLWLRFFLRRRTARTAFPSKFGYLLNLFLAICLASLFNTVALRLTALKLCAFVALAYIGSQAGGRLVERYGPAAARHLLYGLAAYSIGLVGLAIAQYLIAPHTVTAITGFFAGYLGNPNAWAMFAMTLLPWMACPLFRRRQLTGPFRLALSIGLLTSAYSLLLTGSRAGLLGAIVAMTVMCLVHANLKIGAAALVITALFGAKILIEPGFISRLTKRYVYKQRHNETDFLQSRLEPWKRAKQNFQERPWLGWGFGVSSRAQSGWTFDVRSGSSAVETGSSFWAALNQVGILGSATLFSALASVLIKGGFFAKRVRDPSFTAIYGSTLALAANALFEGWLLAPGNFTTAYFWVQCFFLDEMMRRFRPVTNGGLSRRQCG